MGRSSFSGVCRCLPIGPAPAYRYPRTRVTRVWCVKKKPHYPELIFGSAAILYGPASSSPNFQDSRRPVGRGPVLPSTSDSPGRGGQNDAANRSADASQPCRTFPRDLMPSAEQTKNSHTHTSLQRAWSGVICDGFIGANQRWEIYRSREN